MFCRIFAFSMLFRQIFPVYIVGGGRPHSSRVRQELRWRGSWMRSFGGSAHCRMSLACAQVVGRKTVRRDARRMFIVCLSTAEDGVAAEPAERAGGARE